jgi:DNA-binding PadR family transcriptional regulator
MTDFDNHLPLREAAFFILLSLASGPLHGYAILKEVAELSDQRLILSTGTLYGALKRFLERGWIERVEAAVEKVDGRQRKAYRLTQAGSAVLAAEVQRLGHMVSLARNRVEVDLS